MRRGFTRESYQASLKLDSWTELEKSGLQGWRLADPLVKFDALPGSFAWKLTISEPSNGQSRSVHSRSTRGSGQGYVVTQPELMSITPDESVVLFLSAPLDFALIDIESVTDMSLEISQRRSIDPDDPESEA